MITVAKTRRVLAFTGGLVNKAVSFIVFSLLDLVDLVLCFVYKVVDFFIEAEWKPCYCSSSKEAITSSGKILVSEQGESKIVCLSSSKLQLEEISDTLYTRPSQLSELSRKLSQKVDGTMVQACEKKNKNGTVRSTFTVNSTIVEMLQGKIVGQALMSHPMPRWSDCDCQFCTCWTSSNKDTLFVRAQGRRGRYMSLIKALELKTF